MIRKVLIASLLLCTFALAQPPEGAPAMSGGPGFGGPHGNFGQHGPKPGGDLHGILPPGRWWKDTEIVKTIGLNDDQVQKIETIFQKSRMELVDVHASLQKEELKLEPLLEADTPDEKAVLVAIDRITGARANLEKANARMAFSIRSVLSPEQWKKLRALRPRREHFPPPGPFGGRHAKFQHDGRHPMPPLPAEPSAPPIPESAAAPESSK